MVRAARSGDGSLRLGADRSWQKATVVLAHFFGHEFVQQGVHSQYDILILFRINGQIVYLERVVHQVKELQVVVAQNLLERFRRIEVGGRIVARELIPPVESKTEKSPLAEFGLQLRQGWRDFSLEQLRHPRQAIVRIDSQGSDIVEEDTRAHGLRSGGFGSLPDA